MTNPQTNKQNPDVLDFQEKLNKAIAESKNQAKAKAPAQTADKKPDSADKGEPQAKTDAKGEPAPKPAKRGRKKKADADAAGDASQAAQAETKPKDELEEFISKPPLEILQHYNKNITDKEFKEFVKMYEEVLETRDEMTAKMKALAEWAKDKKMDFPTFKHVYKRANNPVKKQNLIDASFAWIAKKLGGSYQPKLFE